jgi:hypothetical protein
MTVPEARPVPETRHAAPDETADVVVVGSGSAAAAAALRAALLRFSIR